MGWGVCMTGFKWVGFLLLPVILGALVLSCQVGESELPSFHTRKQTIIGGKKDNRYPAIGALSLDKKNKFCSATLVTDRFILSAAHCIGRVVSQLKKKKKAYFRADFPKTSGTGFTSEYYEIASAQNHPGYGGNGGGIRDDVGFAVLKAPATKVTPIPISSASMDSTWAKRKLLFLGYGLIQTQPKRQGTNQKYSVELPIRRVLSDRFEVYEPKKSICSGDSGGPALYSVDGRLRVVGVNSYVQGTQTKGQANCDGSGYCFRVDTYLAWMMPHLNKFGHQCINDADCGGCYKCKNKACVLEYETPAQTLCKPCTTPADCGGGGNLCVRTTSGNRCMQACGKKNCCPKDYACTNVGSGQFQCTPKNMVCPVVACKSDADCGPGEQCSSGKCRPKSIPADAKLCKACKTKSDCAKDAVCQPYTEGGRCTQPCVFDLFCPDGYECKSLPGLTKRQCLPKQGFCSCKANSDCTTPFACDKGRCKIPGGGKMGDACDVVTHPCSKEYGCFRSSEGNVCLKTCYVSKEYPRGAPGSYCRNASTCDNNSSCVLVQNQARLCMDMCTKASDCRNGGNCTNVGNGGVCLCSSDKNCKNGTKCNMSVLGNVGVCTKPVALNNTRKCEANEYCQTFAPELSVCVPRGYREPGLSCSEVKPCLSGTRCTQVKSGEAFCFAQCTTGQCEGGGKCVNSTNGRLCVCDEKARCFAGYHCRLTDDTGGACAKGPAPSCEKDWVCGKGEICQNKACVKDPNYCANDEDCTAPATCIFNQCVTPEVIEPEPSAEPGPEKVVDTSEKSTETETAAEPGPEPVQDASSQTEPGPEAKEKDDSHIEKSIIIRDPDRGPYEAPGGGGQCGCESTGTGPSAPVSFAFFVLFGLLLIRRRG